MMKHFVFLLVLSLCLVYNVSGQAPVGLAATASWINPDTMIKHNYYVWYQPGINIGNCYTLPPAAVRAATPPNEILFLASLGSEAERAAVAAIVKSQKPPYTFSQATAYGVDNFYDVNTGKYVSMYGKCNKVLPWGDPCVGIPKEPNGNTQPVLEYCTAMDFRATILCKPGDGCSDNGKAPYDPTRKCNYDGVYNDYQCTLPLTGCIYESAPYSEVSTQFICDASGTQSTCADGTVSRLRNGGFELGQYTAGTTTFTFSGATNGIFGWTVKVGTVSAVTTAVYSTAAGGGKYSLLLNPSGAGGVIEQTIALDRAVQRSYKLSFQASAKPGGKASRLVVNIINSSGQLLQTRTIQLAAAPAGTAPSWSANSVDFVSVINEQFYTIQFKADSLDVAEAPIIDQVTVCAGQAVTQDSPCNIPDKTIALRAGWDVFPPETKLPTLTWGLKGNVLTASVFLPDETVQRRLGIHFLYKTEAECKASPPYVYSTFGNLRINPSPYYCVAFTRQGVTMYGAILDLLLADQFVTRPVTTPSAGHAATLVATGIAPGNYSLEFSVRDTPNSLSIIWQSSKTFGSDLINFNVCPPAPSCAVGSQLLDNGNFNKGTYLGSYQGPTLSSVGVNKGNYDVVGTIASSPITGWTIAAGQVLWSSGAWSNYPGNTMSLGLLPAASISHEFTVPDDKGGYQLSFYAKINPWTQNPALDSSSFPQIQIVVTDVVTGTIAAAQGTYAISFTDDKEFKQYRYVFPVIPGRFKYLLTITCQVPKIGLQDLVISTVNPATYRYGVIISTLTLCQTASPPTRFDYSQYCGTQTQYIVNPMFEPYNPGGNAPPPTKGLIPVGVNSNRLYPWVITANEIDHYFGMWQNPAGANYTVDMTGTAPRRAGILQQPLTLPSAGGNFVLKFALSGNPDCGNIDTAKKVKVTVTDSTSNAKVVENTYEFSIVGITDPNMGWVGKDLPFKANAGSTKYVLSFESLNTNSDCGVVIANVFLCGAADAPPESRPMVCNAGRSANSLSNGDFELTQYKPTVPISVVYPGGVYINSWAITSGTVELITPPEWTAYSGTNSLDMSGISAGTIAQTVHLGAGGYTWTLSFAMAANPGGVQKKDMSVSIYKADSASFKSGNNLVTTQKFSWLSNQNVQNGKNMGWQVMSMTFTALREISDYVIEFKSLTVGYAGVALDDVKLCSPQTIPPPVPVTPQDQQIALDSGPSEWTITADDNFDFYVNGIEQKPPNAPAIDRLTGGCKGVATLYSKTHHCCNNAASNTNPRCGWPSSETFNVSTTGLAIAAFYVENHNMAGGTGPRASDANPAGLLVSYKRNGRQCGASNAAEYRCSFTVSQADQDSGAWTQLNYDDSTWTNAVEIGYNKKGGQGGKDPVWISSNNGKPIAGIPPNAAWIWGAYPYANGGAYPGMWCRTYFPTLYC